MEFLGLVIFGFLVYETIKFIIPLNPFTSSTSFMTGFWTYIWFSKSFRGAIKKVIKLVILIIILFFFLVIINKI